jgi:diguanylate cyclase (GGDEF)-like protein
MPKISFESAVKCAPLCVRKPLARFLVGVADVMYPEVMKPSMIDEETGLLKRKAFRNEFYKRFEQKSPGKRYLVFFDGDGFGAINKEHGHRIGDDVISDLAQRIQRGMRSGDLIGRYGGDEFIAYCDGTPDPQTLYRRLEDINSSLRSDYGSLLSLSIGAAEVVDGSFSQTITLADEAQRVIKQNGGNGVKIHGFSSYTLPYTP